MKEDIKMLRLIPVSRFLLGVTLTCITLTLSGCQQIPYTGPIHYGWVEDAYTDEDGKEVVIIWDGFDRTVFVREILHTKEIVEKIIEIVVIEEVVKEVPVEVVVEKVVERIVEKEKVVEVEVPVEVEVERVVEVPIEVFVTETVEVIKEVIKEVEVPGPEVIREVEVIKEVEVEKIVTQIIESSPHYGNPTNYRNLPEDGRDSVHYHSFTHAHGNRDTHTHHFFHPDGTQDDWDEIHRTLPHE